MTDSEKKGIAAALMLAAVDARMARDGLPSGHAALVGDEIGNALVPVLACIDVCESELRGCGYDMEEDEAGTRAARLGIERLKRLLAALKGKAQ
jgi:hypothetical protein